MQTMLALQGAAKAEQEKRRKKARRAKRVAKARGYRGVPEAILAKRVAEARERMKELRKERRRAR